MQTVIGSQRTGLLKKTILVRLPGCMPTCIGGKAMKVTPGIGMHELDDLQLAALSNQNGKRSLPH